VAIALYYTWNDLGRPFELAQPIRDIKAWAKRNNVPWLGDLGNEEHLTADHPQDHTPYSTTAWPIPLDGWMVTAGDAANVTLPDGRTLGQAVEANARAGLLPWLKYMNHAGRHLDSRDLDGDGLTWEVYPSSDAHCHFSIRTDWQHKSLGADPFKLGDLVDMTDAYNLLDQLLRTQGAATYPNPRYGTTPIARVAELAHMAAFDARKSADGIEALAVKVDALTHLLQQLITAGGGNVDVAAFLAGLDERLATQREEFDAKLAAAREAIEADTRDAVADAAEGGAAAARADSD
jgi:hypothetical protein